MTPLNNIRISNQFIHENNRNNIRSEIVENNQLIPSDVQSRQQEVFRSKKRKYEEMRSGESEDIRLNVEDIKLELVNFTECLELMKVETHELN